MKRGTKTALIWFLLVAVVFVAVFNNGLNTKSRREVPEEIALAMIKAGTIDSYRMEREGLVLKTIAGDEVRIAPPGGGRTMRQLMEAKIPAAPQQISQTSQPSESTLIDLITILLPLIIVVLVVVYFLRRMGGGMYSKLFDLRQSKARPLQDADKARFTDIGGNREAVELLEDIVDFLKSPARWTAAGARIPRGVLVVGPPGTGKTLLARAVAGETNSGFIYTSAAEFVEMFCGVGAARVRDTFEKAAAQQPAVIFIDELDAVGRRRGSGVGTMHEEREQTLNQLLVSMDGLEQRARLVVMAATNRPDILDPALLRSGRFDRLLRLNPPTLDERVDILKIHTRNKTLDADVALEQIARQTDGFTGADLETLANEASLRAVRRTRAESNGRDLPVTLKMNDFDCARKSMIKSNRQFDRLDTVLVESVSQFSEPTGRAIARITLTTGAIVEGEVLWMNATHIKLRVTDGSEVVIAKENAVQFVPLSGTESTAQGDFQPDRWAGQSLDVG